MAFTAGNSFYEKGVDNVFIVSGGQLAHFLHGTAGQTLLTEIRLQNPVPSMFAAPESPATQPTADCSSACCRLNNYYRLHHSALQLRVS